MPRQRRSGYIATIGRMARRGETIELAVLGLLHEGPMHGYELRKRLNLMLGWGRVLSYGSLYPALKKMLRASLIEETAAIAHPGHAAPADRLPGHRGRAPRVRAPDVGGRADRVGGRQLRHPLRVLRAHRHGDPAARPRGPPHPSPGAARPGPEGPGPDPDRGRRLRRRAPAPRRGVGRAGGHLALGPDQGGAQPPHRAAAAEAARASSSTSTATTPEDQRQEESRWDRIKLQSWAWATAPRP